MSGMRIVFLGLSITSSWGNGHATTYRGLVRELVRRGCDVTFLERDVPWYAANRDMANPPWGRTILYGSLEELRDAHTARVRDADAVIVGSFVPDGVTVGHWIQATARGVACFYDIDTPVTLAALERGECAYLSPELVPGYDVYLSFTGGPTLRKIERRWGSPMARALYCSADPNVYRPEPREERWLMGYLGTYSPDRQPGLDSMLLEPARRMPNERFIVAGPQYPADLKWPANVERIDHLAPGDHRAFYNAQRFALNVTRADMRAAGWSPSVRLFEAAACGAAIVSDPWPGLDELFDPKNEILISQAPEDAFAALSKHGRDAARAMGERARARVLASHTAAHRAAELESHLGEAMERRAEARALVGS